MTRFIFDAFSIQTLQNYTLVPPLDAFLPQPDDTDAPIGPLVDETGRAFTGTTFALVGDIDGSGDGVADFIVLNDLGSVISGADGTVTKVFGIPGLPDFPGDAPGASDSLTSIYDVSSAFWDAIGMPQVVGLQDVNGDGIDDVALSSGFVPLYLIVDEDPTDVLVGVSDPAGAVFRIDGSSLQQTQTANGDPDYIAETDRVLTRTVTDLGSTEWGRFLHNVGDLDGDLIDDLLVAQPRADKETADASDVNQRLEVLSGATFGTLLLIDDPINNGGFKGWSATGMGDLNDDGINDFAVSDYRSVDTDATGFARGSVQFISGLDGTVLGEVRNTDTSGTEYGAMIASIGDQNGDGVEDLAVGYADYHAGSRDNVGRVYVLSGADFGATTLSVLQGSSEDGHFGQYIARLGDLDGNGVEEFAIAVPGNDRRGAPDFSVSFFTAARFEIGNYTSTLSPFTPINGVIPAGQNHMELGDFDGDGDTELALIGRGATGAETEIIDFEAAAALPNPGGFEIGSAPIFIGNGINIEDTGALSPNRWYGLTIAIERAIGRDVSDLFAFDLDPGATVMRVSDDGNSIVSTFNGAVFATFEAQPGRIIVRLPAADDPDAPFIGDTVVGRILSGLTFETTEPENGPLELHWTLASAEGSTSLTQTIEIMGNSSTGGGDGGSTEPESRTLTIAVTEAVSEGTGLETDDTFSPSEIEWTFSLDQAASTNITLAYNLAPDDAPLGTADADDFLDATTGTVTLPAGTLQATLRARIDGDFIFETDEIIQATFVAQGIDPDVLTLTVLGPDAAPIIENDDSALPDPDPIRLTLEGSSVVEGDVGRTSAFVDFRLNQALTADAHIDWAIAGAGPNDITASQDTAGQIKIAAGELSARLEIEIAGDDLVELDETLAISVTNFEGDGRPLDEVPNTATVRILNDDSADITLSSVTIPEGDLAGPAGEVPMTFFARLSNPVDVPVQVDWMLSDVTTDMNDFVPDQPVNGVIAFSAGSTVSAVTISVQGDRAVENDESFDVVLSDTPMASGRAVTAGTSAKGTILNDDLLSNVTLSILSEDQSVIEGTGGTTEMAFELGLLTLGMDDVPATLPFDVEIPYRVFFATASAGPTADAGDFAPGFRNADTVTLKAGEATTEIRLAIDADSVGERNETFGLLIGTPTSPAGTLNQQDIFVRGTIVDDDAPVVNIYAEDDVLYEDLLPADWRELPPEDIEFLNEYKFRIEREGDFTDALLVDWGVATAVLAPAWIIRDPQTMVPELTYEHRTFNGVAGAEGVSNTVNLSWTENINDFGKFFEGVTDANGNQLDFLDKTQSLINLADTLSTDELSFLNADYEISAGPLDLDFSLNLRPEIEAVFKGRRIDSQEEGETPVYADPTYGGLLFNYTLPGGFQVPNFAVAGEQFDIVTTSGKSQINYQTLPLEVGEITLEAVLQTNGLNGITRLRVNSFGTDEPVVNIVDPLILPDIDERITLATLNEDGLTTIVGETLEKLPGIDITSPLPDIDIPGGLSFQLPSLEGKSGSTTAGLNTALYFVPDPGQLIGVGGSMLQLFPFINTASEFFNPEISLGDIESAVASAAGSESESFGLDKLVSFEASFTTFDWEFDAGIGLAMRLFVVPKAPSWSASIDGAEQISPETNPVFGTVDLTTDRGLPEQFASSLTFRAPDTSFDRLSGIATVQQNFEVGVEFILKGVAENSFTALSGKVEAGVSDLIEQVSAVFGVDTPSFEFEFEGISPAEEAGELPDFTGALAKTVFSASKVIETDPIEYRFEVPVIDAQNIELTGQVRFGENESDPKYVTLPTVSDDSREPLVLIRNQILNAVTEDGGFVNIGIGEALTTYQDDDWITETDLHLPEPIEFIRAIAAGDPHLITLDGLPYDFHATGDFVLSESVSGDDFMLQGRFSPVSDTGLGTVTTGIALGIGGSRVAFDLRRPDQLEVDGTLQSFGLVSQVMLDGITATRFDDQISLFTTAGDRVDLTVRDGFLDVGFDLAEDRAGHVRGLLGDFDGDLSNDLALADGTSLGLTPDFATLYADFAEDWALQAGTTLFIDPPTPMETPEAVFDPDLLPDWILDDANARLDESGISDPIARSNALYDLLLTGNSDFIESAALVQSNGGGRLASHSNPINAPVIASGVSVRALTDRVTEGDTAFYEVYRFGDLSQALEVTYTIGGDVEAADVVGDLTGAASFASGGQSVLISVETRLDGTAEANEDIAVQLETAGTSIVAAEASVTLADGDGGVTATYAAHAIDTVEEGDTAVFLITRSGANLPAVDINYTIPTGTASSGDFAPGLTGQIAMGAGLTRAVLTLPTLEDRLVEGEEQFDLVFDFLDGPQTLTFTIQDNDVRPEVSDDLAVTGFETPVAISVFDNDTGPNLDVSQAEIVAEPDFGSVVFDTSTGQAFYEPQAGFIGTDQFSYTVRSSQGIVSDEAIVTVTVEPPTAEARGLVARDDTIWTGVSSPIVFDPLINDTGSTALTITGTSVPATGNVTVLPNGLIEFDPEGTEIPALGASTLIEFSYTISDGFAESEAQVYVGVVPEPVDPIIDVTGGLRNLRGTDEIDLLLGNENDDYIRALRGDDVINPGLGEDVLVLGDGLDTITGTTAEIGGDLVLDFAEEDILFLEGTAQSRTGAMLELDERRLSIDIGGDGIEDAAIFLGGDYSEGDFMAVSQKDGTRISFEHFLIPLEEERAVSPEDVNGIANQFFLTAYQTTDFAVQLIGDVAFADFDNVLGVYEITPEGDITDARLLSPNVKENTDTPLLIKDVDFGHTLGFFIVQNAASWASGMVETDEISFIAEGGRQAKISDGDAVRLSVNGSEAAVTVFHSYDPVLNFDGVSHVVSGVAPGGDALIVGFEERTGGGDRDFQDVVFSVSLADSFTPQDLYENFGADRRFDPSLKSVNEDGKAPLAILDLGDRAKTVVVNENTESILLLNKLVEWRPTGAVETADGKAFYSDVESGFGVHIAAASGDAGRQKDGFQIGFRSKQIDVQDPDGRVAAELVTLFQFAEAGDAVGSEGDINLRLGEVSDTLVEIVIDGHWSSDVLSIQGSLAEELIDEANSFSNELFF